jgi:hypothetical protein
VAYVNGCARRIDGTNNRVQNAQFTAFSAQKLAGRDPEIAQMSLTCGLTAVIMAAISRFRAL